MTLEEIKQAVDAGETVCWKNTAYVVGKDKLGYRVKYVHNNMMFGLEFEGRLQGNEVDYFIKTN